MSAHDSLCPWTEMAGHGVTPPPEDDCIYCPLIRAARANEFELAYKDVIGRARAGHDHAEAVAAKLVEVVCEQDDLIQIVGVDATNHRAAAADMRRERDAARAEVERLQRLVAVLEKMLDTEAMVLADERERVEKVLTEAWGAAKASWRSGGDTYWEGRMDALDYAIRIAGGEQP